MMVDNDNKTNLQSRNEWSAVDDKLVERSVLSCKKVESAKLVELTTMVELVC